MGRELRRVPMDFDWPIGKVWDGYLLPKDLHFPQCADCEGTGYGPEARAVAETFYPRQIGGPHAARLAWHDKIGQAEVDNLLAQGRLRTLVRREPTDDNPRDWEWIAQPRTAGQVNASQHMTGLDAHDAINRMVMIRFRCQRLGIPLHCPTCGGEGNIATPEQRQAAKAWERTDPPEGEGYQLWATTSEGSPATPVFATLDELCAYAERHCTVFAGSRASFVEWRRMLSAGDVVLEETMPDGTTVTWI